MIDPWNNLFVVANVLQFSFGLAITGISYWAYRSNGRKPSLRNATIGFLCITIGGILAPVYEIGIKADYNITAQELLKLQIMEGAVIGIGLALLLFSVYSHSTSRSRETHIEYEIQDVDRRGDT